MHVHARARSVNSRAPFRFLIATITTFTSLAQAAAYKAETEAKDALIAELRKTSSTWYTLSETLRSDKDKQFDKILSVWHS